MTSFFLYPSPVSSFYAKLLLWLFPFSLLIFWYFVDLNGFEVEHRPSHPSALPILIPKGK
jgi:hypothetical protein